MPRKAFSDAVAAFTRATISASVRARRRRFLSCSVSERAERTAKGLWAVLGGYRPFVCLIGGSQERAIELLTPIRKAILENSVLLADFPKAIHPLRSLQNNARRQIGQHIDGRPTYCPGNPHESVAGPIWDAVIRDRLTEANVSLLIRDLPSSTRPPSWRVRSRRRWSARS